VRLAAYLHRAGCEGPGAATTRLLRDFVLELKDAGMAPTSIARNLSAIRTYFGFLLGESLVVSDPSERVQSPKAWRTLPEVLTVAEIETLLETPDLSHPLAWRDRALLEFAYASG